MTGKRNQTSRRAASGFGPIVAVLSFVGCAGLEPVSHEVNPVGWPAKALSGSGAWAADSEVPLLRETGRLLYALGDLLEAPALLVEAPCTLNPERLEHSAYKTITGTGSTLTAALNLPFFFVAGPNVDLGRDAAAINQALEHIETCDPDVWRLEGDSRDSLFPRGTRVRRSGKNLIWTVPGVGDVIQSGEWSLLLLLAEETAGTSYYIQERSWGMVTRSLTDWNERAERQRATTIIHEFYHQQAQLHGWFLGWTVFYWPAYGYSFAADGWWGHWAEAVGGHGAYAVDRALANWPKP